MAKCRKCSKQVTWAEISNGKFAGKNRPFDHKGSADGGKFQYALSDTGEVDTYDNPKLAAKFYDDPIEGLERNEVLYSNHFDTCEEKGDYSAAPSGGSKVFATVQIGGDDYSGYLNKVEKKAEKAEEAAF